MLYGRSFQYIAECLKQRDDNRNNDNTTNKDLPWRFLPRYITTVAITGKRISSIFFWQRPLIETEIKSNTTNKNLPWCRAFSVAAPTL